MENTSSVQTIGRDTPCCRCGYNLRGLGVDGRCPECGEAVEISQAGRHLGASDPRWRRRLRLGAGLHAGGLIGFLLMIVLSLWYNVSTRSALLDCMLVIVAISLGAAGAWLTTSSEPGGPYFDDARWLRRLVRGLAVLSWSGMVGYASIQGNWIDFRRSPGEMALWLNVTGTLGFGGSLLTTSMAIWNLSRLAKRLDGSLLVLFGRVSAFSPAITMGVAWGIVDLMSYLGLRGSPLVWLMLTLSTVVFIWPATYQLVWCRWVGGIARPAS